MKIIRNIVIALLLMTILSFLIMKVIDKIRSLPKGGYKIQNLDKYDNIKIRNIGNMKYPRAYHQSSVLKDGRIFITGGYDGTSDAGTTLTEFYNPKLNKFEKGPQMNLPHLYHKQFTLSTGEVAILDINGIEIYNPSSNKFELMDDKLLTRYNRYLNSVNYLLINHQILVTGGYECNPLGTSCKKVDYAELVDIKNKKILKIDKLNNVRANHSSILVAPNVAYLFFGSDIDEDTIERFNLNSKKFEVVDKIHYKLSLPFLICKQNEILIFGGSYLLNKSNLISFFDIKNEKIYKKISTQVKWTKNIDSKIFNLNNNNILFVNYERHNNTIKCLLTIYNLDTSKIKTIEAPLPVYSNITQLTNTQFLVTGGESLNIKDSSSDAVCLPNSPLLCKEGAPQKNAYIISINI